MKIGSSDPIFISDKSMQTILMAGNFYSMAGGILRAVAFGLFLGTGLAAHAVLPFGNTGNLYVSMWTADEIAVFTPDGIALERFTADGLDGPRGIAFNPVNGEIWVAGEFSDAIYIFDHNHQLLRTLQHPDFNEPVGVTFAIEDGVAESPLVYISNSNGNEILVFEQQGMLLRRFSAPALVDPNCSAFMPDGSLFVANRLGGTTGSVGAVSRFDANEEFLFDFTADGIQSLMAIARDPNDSADGFDDTIWVTSGGGDTGIYEFDQSGNLLASMLPADIDDGRSIVPQGIAFDDNGDFYVVSFLNEVIKFDSSGNFLMRFPTGEGTSRSTAIQACQADSAGSPSCLPLGVDAVVTESGGMENDLSGEPQNPVSASDVDSVSDTDNDSGSGSKDLLLLASLLLLLARKRWHDFKAV